MRSEATQITVFAPDGFSKTFLIDAPDPQTAPNIQYDVMGPYPMVTITEGWTSPNTVMTLAILMALRFRTSSTCFSDICGTETP